MINFAIMKKLLIATDFSATAKHAAEYAYLLAKQLKAGLFLCNIITIPAEVPMSGMVAWPDGESDSLLDDSTAEIKRLKAHLEQTDHTDTFRPPVDYLNEAGAMIQMVNDSAFKQHVDLIIAGAHQQDRLGTLLSGNHTDRLIQNCIKPLLIVPNAAPFKPIKKIAFATDLEHPENDLEQLYELITLAALLDAEILLTHVHTENGDAENFEKNIKKFLVEVSNTANYPKIYYRSIKHHQLEPGLDWLCVHGQIDMLAMVHRKRGFLDGILHGSHTKKMAGHITIPLLVYPAGE
jgi:nucleotide-binding universal stress UspA family protein